MPAFPGDHRFIGPRLSLENHAVDGNALARPHPHQHAGVDLPDRPAMFDAAIDHSRALAFRRQERLEIAGGPGPTDRFEIAASGEQHQHHGGGVKVDPRALLDDGKGGISIGGADANDDQRRRRQPAADGVEPRLDQKRSAENDDRRRGQISKAGARPPGSTFASAAARMRRYRARC